MPAHTAPGRDDSPAVALGPTALFLGLGAATGLLPQLTLGLFPLMLIGGALAVVFGLTGVHYALRGIGRLWIATTGAVLGAIAFAYPFVLFLPFWTA
ncbi:hypothetical protein [Streptomyces naphthomycinicus]|uniref:hypothetical protein n=1 Tax=Streptomyces naphthomycinicus TaxID=2872625 RepID=UPI001CECFBD3|nr:hypothetical protein [Streptomyces sp. TML10]